MQLPQGVLSWVPYAFPWIPLGMECISWVVYMYLFSLSLYLYAFFVSAILSIYLCTFSVGSLLYTDVQGFCIYLICVAHELHTSALWCSCLVPKLIHGVPTGCPMWPLWIPVGLRCISLGLLTDFMWKSSGCPIRSFRHAVTLYVFLLCFPMSFLYIPYGIPMPLSGILCWFSIHFMLLSYEFESLWCRQTLWLCPSTWV